MGKIKGVYREEGMQLTMYRTYSSSLETRPIKIRPGLYCMGDSAHVQTESPRIWVTRIQFI